MARRVATLQDLLNKPARTKDLAIKVPTANGGKAEVVVKLRAVGSKEYDDLLASNPPTAEQRRDGGTYDPDKFAPALIAACSVEPKMTADDAKAIWASADWSRGELSELFLACVEVCSTGLDIPFSETD